MNGTDSKKYKTSCSLWFVKMPKFLTLWIFFEVKIEVKMIKCKIILMKKLFFIIKCISVLEI